MKKRNYEITTIGTPSVENLSETEARNFYLSMLARILEKHIDSKKEREEQNENKN